MITLEQYFIESKNLCDKGRLRHNYIQEYYSPEFTSLREKPINLLELGIGGYDSLQLWSEWFVNGNIIGVDNNPDKSQRYKISELPVTEICADAYDMETVNQFQDNYFDYIIEDTEHDAETQILCPQYYLPKLKKGGKLIIEDIQPEYHDEVIYEINKLDIPYVYMDLRNFDNVSSDNILLIFTK